LAAQAEEARIKSQRDYSVQREQEKKAKIEPMTTKKCPFCAEEILLNAIKCKHCKSDIPGATL